MTEPEYPEGLCYRADFLGVDEEASLVSAIETVTFSHFEMRGVVAKRRVAFFGETYGRQREAPIPAFLQESRRRLAAWAGLDPGFDFGGR